MATPARPCPDRSCLRTGSQGKPSSRLHGDGRAACEHVFRPRGRIVGRSVPRRGVIAIGDPDRPGEPLYFIIHSPPFDALGSVEGEGGVNKVTVAL